jgi:hypothetical protein
MSIEKIPFNLIFPSGHLLIANFNENQEKSNSTLIFFKSFGARDRG